MKTVDVVILKGGRTAKEINYLGEKPRRGLRVKDMSKALKEGLKQKTKEWKEVEAKRRIFEIELSDLIPLFKKLEEALAGEIHHAHVGYAEGSYHKAQLLHTGKIKIL